MTLIFVIIIIDRWELKKNPRNNDDDPNRQSEKSSEEKMSSKLPCSLFERNCYVLFILNFVIYFRLRREALEAKKKI